MTCNVVMLQDNHDVGPAHVYILTTRPPNRCIACRVPCQKAPQNLYPAAARQRICPCAGNDTCGCTWQPLSALVQPTHDLRMGVACTSDRWLLAAAATAAANDELSGSAKSPRLVSVGGSGEQYRIAGFGPVALAERPSPIPWPVSKTHTHTTEALVQGHTCPESRISPKDRCCKLYA
jgi:hypothetical protein